ncbi:nitroreductase family protein [Treponema sp. OttesenSCG-928-L16]|nr:nitroreductase family protein [Treponema sp. OttesenSCG-928-L16]
METLRVILKRKSVRGFKSVQIPDNALNIIIKAGCAAPVANGDYSSLHLGIIQNRLMLNRIRAAISEAAGEKADFLYGAPTLIIISSRQRGALHIEVANAACVAQNMMLMATDLEIGSVYVLGPVLAFKPDAEWAKELELPDNFFPTAAVALGYSAGRPGAAKQMINTIPIRHLI